MQCVPVAWYEYLCQARLSSSSPSWSLEVFPGRAMHQSGQGRPRRKRASALGSFLLSALVILLFLPNSTPSSTANIVVRCDMIPTVSLLL